MVENTSRSPMITIRLLCKTVIFAKKFRVQADHIFVGDLKYKDEGDMPAFIEDSMLISKDAIESYAIVHIGGEEEDEVSEDRDDTPSPA